MSDLKASSTPYFEQILLLEDNQRLANTLQEFLPAYCTELHYCATVSEAISYVNSSGIPALMIADYHLPDGTVIDFLKQFPSKLNIIIMSEVAVAADGFELAQLGAQTYLAKPFSLEQLESTLETAFQSTHSTIELHTFSGFKIYINGEFLKFNKPPKKLFAILKAMIAQGGEQVSINNLIDLLWEDSDADNAMNSFNTSLNRIRKLLGHDNSILNSNGLLCFNRDIVDTDVWQLQDTTENKHPARLTDGQRQHFASPWLPEDDSYWLLEARKKIEALAKKLPSNDFTMK
jgi:DNA-binding response OmpR family regulator